MTVNAHRFDDPDEFRAAFRHPDAGMELSLTRHGMFAAALTSVELPAMRLLSGRESLPRVSRITRSPQRLTFSFATDDAQGWRFDGHEMARGVLMAQAPGSCVLSATQGPVDWSVVSLAVADLQRMVRCRCGADGAMPRHDRLLRPAATAMVRLRTLHRRIMARLLESAIMRQCPASARAAEQQLADALLDCLDWDGWAALPAPADPTRRQLVMARAYEFLEQAIDQPVLLADLAEAVGATERTVALAFHHHVGISPKRFLLLRRLNLVRRALLDAAPGTLRVADAATQFGFWEFGRFAAAYRGLFGEAPSQTLRRPRMEAARVSGPWF